MFTFRMYTDLRFERPIDPERDFVSFGEIAFIAGGELYSFEFMDIESFIDKDDPSLLHTVMKNPDYAGSPNIEGLMPEDLKSVSLIEGIEFYSLSPSVPLLGKEFEAVAFELIYPSNGGVNERETIEVEKEAFNALNEEIGGNK